MLIIIQKNLPFFDLHPIHHSLVSPRVKRNAVGIATMHVECPRIDAIAGFLVHAYRSFFWVVQANVIDAILDEKAVSLSGGFVSEKLVGKMVFPRNDGKRPFAKQAEILVKLHDFKVFQIDKLNEIVEFQCCGMVLGGQHLAIPTNYLVHLIVDNQTEQVAIPNAQSKFVLFFWNQTVINRKYLIQIGLAHIDRHRINETIEEMSLLQGVVFQHVVVGLRLPVKLLYIIVVLLVGCVVQQI